MGAVSGAFAAAATTPLDVIKTRMMCTAATRPSMRGAAGKVWAQVSGHINFSGEIHLNLWQLRCTSK